MKIIRFSQKGLVGCWRFDEETGSTAKDSSPYGNDGTIYGATRVRGIIGKALSFDGVDDYVEVPDSASLDITDEITIGAWVKINSMPPTATTVIRKGYQEGGSPGSVPYMFYIDNYFNFYGSNGSQWIFNVKFTPPVGEWFHVVGTFDGSTAIIYKNGVEQNRKTGITEKMFTNDLNLYIGTMWTDYFNGIIDEVRIYNRALSPREIKIIYAFTKYIKPHPIIMRRKL